MTILGLLPPLLELFAARGAGGRDWRKTFEQLAHRVRFTPFAWGGAAVGDAARGGVVAAIGWLLASAALIAGLLWIWSRALERGLTSSDAPAPPPRRGRSGAGLIPRAVRFLPRNRIGAVAAKDLRYFARDPRRRAPLIGALVIPVVALTASLSQGTNRPASTTLLALVAVLPAAGLTLNQFGLDGAALWVSVAAGNDPRADLTGKNIASMLVMVPLATVATFVSALFTHGWAYVPLTLGLAPAIFGVLLGVGNVMSVRVPYAMPDRRNPARVQSRPGLRDAARGLRRARRAGGPADSGGRARRGPAPHAVAGRRDARHRRDRERLRRRDLVAGPADRVAQTRGGAFPSCSRRSRRAKPADRERSRRRVRGRARPGRTEPDTT